jgi:hypothetical protein
MLQLKTPEIINIAIKNNKEKKSVVLNCFVILSATSLDQQWTNVYMPLFYLTFACLLSLASLSCPIMTLSLITLPTHV